ncbi:MAG: PAS domain S-box protein [Alphaproteobacteria bacterium]
MIMFRLVRFFILTSAVAAAAIMVVLVVYRQNEVDRFIELAESENVKLARTIANTIGPRLLSYLKSTSGLDKDELSESPEMRAIGETVMTVSAGLPVLKVKIYNFAGCTIYSSEPNEIGSDKSNNPEAFSAARNGKPATRLTYRDTIGSFEGTVHDRDVVETYLPIRQGDGPVEGIFELYTDVTSVLTGIKRSTAELFFGFFLIFGPAYGILLLIVRRADRTIKRQHLEITEKNAALHFAFTECKRVEEALKNAHDELEQRVVQRTRELTEEIVERKQAEERLRKLSRAVEQSPAMTIITDLAGKIEYVNTRFTEVTGYTLEEVAGKTPRVLKSGELRPEEYEKLWKTITSGKEWRGEMHNRKKNGQLYWALTSILPITNQSGAVTHLLGISEDITERKRAEADARRHRNQLAHFGRVSVMGEMATSLAHELNQPLTVISGCTQVCLNKLRSGDHETRELLRSVEKMAGQAERANEIIHRIRAFIRKEERERARIDLNGAIRDVADLLRVDAREHGAAVSFDLADDLPVVVADPIEIQQVILNLAHNGMEAMRESRLPSRHLTIRTSASRNGMVETTVHDTGQGIPPETLERVFDPFFTTKTTGLGMGLSISRSIIEAHGGRLWASSDGETGTVFHFGLPVAGASHRDDP